MTESESFLMLRRGGAAWAVAHPEVRGVTRRGDGFEVAVGSGTLLADEVLGVAAGLRRLPAGAVLRRFWPEAAQGMIVHGTLPMVLIDPSAPPRSLRAATPVGSPPVESAGEAAATNEEGRRADG